MMGTEGLSAGDILVLTKDNGMNNAWDNPFIYLVWLALLGGDGWHNYCKFTKEW